MRIALFAPIPPTRSGIAAYTAALLPRLARQHDVDLFTAERPRRDDALPAGAAHGFSAHEFLWRRAREPYDLVIYQLGKRRDYRDRRFRCARCGGTLRIRG